MPGTFDYPNVNGLETVLYQDWDTTFSPTGWVNSNQASLLYDNTGFINTELDSNWNDSTKTWSPTGKIIIEYNDFHKPSRSISQAWDSTLWNNYSSIVYKYDAKDSVVSFSEFNWDTLLNSWQTKAIITGRVVYDSAGRVDTIQAKYPMSTEIYTATNIYSYLPDGKLLYEVQQPPISNSNTRILYSYPDTLTEILVSQYGTAADSNWQPAFDSLVLSYNQYGQITSRKDFSNMLCRPIVGFYLWMSENTTFDNLQRPQTQINSMKCQSGNLLVKPDSSRELFFYNSSLPQSLTYSAKKEFRTSVKCLFHENSMIISGLPNNKNPVSVSIYNLKGNKINSHSKWSLLQNCIKIMLPDEIPSSCSFCIIRFQDNSNLTIRTITMK